MLDLRLIEADPQGVTQALAKRGHDFSDVITRLSILVDRRRQLVTTADAQRSRKNEISREIGLLMREKKDTSALRVESDGISTEIENAAAAQREIEEDISRLALEVPNLPADEVIAGGEEKNIELWRRGDIPSFDFPVRDHVALGTAMGAMDFDRTALISGTRFVTLKGALARLERVLGAFMLNMLVQAGFTEYAPPALVRREALIGTGQLPKFADDLYATTNGFLVPTSEVTLTNWVRESVLVRDALPMKMTALTPCFRSEAGAAGRDTRGMIRLHQFNKVEMVVVTHADDSSAQHDAMLNYAESILDLLGLPYRTVQLAAGDMGFGASKTYDIEVWLPSQETYREISSVSNCGDFQARRMDARVRLETGKGTEFVHTLNGSALAVGRTLVAILENNQRQDGSIVIPMALRHLIGGEVITPQGEIAMETC